MINKNIIFGIESHETFGVFLDKDALKVDIDFVLFSKIRVTPYNPFDRIREKEKYFRFENIEIRKKPYSLTLCKRYKEDMDEEEDYAVTSIIRFPNLNDAIAYSVEKYQINIDGITHLGNIIDTINIV
jgi:hypothetical protein